MMDERILQLKQLKKEYKEIRAKAGWGWKTLAWIFGVVSLILAVVTVFVTFNNTAWVQVVDTGIWEPFKAAVKLNVDYAALWRLVEAYGLKALIVSVVITGTFDVLGGVASDNTKKSQAYLNYRTMKLTLEAEQEEK